MRPTFLPLWLWCALAAPLVLACGPLPCVGPNCETSNSSSGNAETSSSGTSMASSGVATSSGGPASSAMGSSFVPSSSQESSSGGVVESSSASSVGSSSSSSTTGGPTLRYTLVIMPDTQNYLRPDNNEPGEDYAALYLAQTRWIADNAAAEKMAAVLHMGDLTFFNLASEWALANTGLSMLDGVVRYIFALGNHDLSDNGFATDRTTLAETVLPVSRFIGQPGFGGVFEAGSMANSWHTLEADGDRYLVVVLEFAPRDEVLTWAANLANSNQDRTVILMMHDYLYWDDTRVGSPGRSYAFNQCDYQVGMLPNSSCNSGEDIWQGLVRNHPNIRFVFNGHHIEDGQGRLISLNDAGNPVFQLLCNYQVRPIGGEGYLRLMRFWDDGRITVEGYSPYLDRQLTDGANRFTIRLSPPAFE